MRRCILLLCLLFTGMATTYAQTGTIRWTWNVSYDRTCGFYMSGTEGGEFWVDWGDGTTEVITGEDSWYGSYINHEYIKGDYAVRLYSLNSEAYIKYFSTSWNSDMQTLDVNDCQALERLSVSSTMLTSLEVKGLPSLTEMKCNSNHQLKSLEINNCPSLTRLECTGNNRLESLSVEGCSSIENLICYDNRLSSLRVSGCENLKYLSAYRNDLSFGEVANVIDSITKFNVKAERAFIPQIHSKLSVRPDIGFPMPELPVIKGTQAHLDIYRNGLKLNDQGYTIDKGQLHFEEIGEYKLVVWHDSVQEYKYGYDEDGYWSYRFMTYGDTTFVVVCNDYVAGNDMVGWSWGKEKSDYKSSQKISFAGTAGETFLIDWGDGERMLVEGTGEMVAYKHECGLDACQVAWRLYATTPTAHILKLQKDYGGYVFDEKLDVSACPELRYLKWNGDSYENRCLAVLDVSRNVNLEYLDCKDNRLTSLDISKNVNLEYVDCSENRLTSLDVSRNVDLEYLNCEDNRLTTVDVSKNKNLKYLDCRYNQLTSLDVSNNVDLEYLNCEDNRLTSLDVSNNVNLEYLNCEVNQLTSLDISKNLNLTDLSCWSNHLTELDVSKNVNLVSLDCGANWLTSLDVSQNVGLEGLDCESNRLTSLEVSKNVGLKRLDCGVNHLTSLDVNQNIALRALSCSGNYLTSLDISKNVNLEDLDCSDNYLTSLDVSRNIELRALECANNRLTVLDVSRNGHLRTLNCEGNRLTNLDLSAQELMSSEATQHHMGFEDNFREVVLDETRSYEMSAFPGMNVDSILSVRGGHLEGTRMIFEADEVEYLYTTGYQRKYLVDYPSDTVWFRLVSNNHSEPQIPLTAEFFPDDIFRAYVTLFDKDGNDSLCKHECAAVKEMILPGSCEGYMVYWRGGVESLEGVQYFGNLKTLECGANVLTSLDISHNPKLVDIYCPHNRLTSLVVSDKPALRWLYCNNNTLTKLEVKNCPKLEHVVCFNNEMERMDISNCPSVDGLSCSNNRLRKLDVSGFPALRSLYCMGNKLSDLKVGEGQQLRDLEISYNSLPLSQIAALRSVWSPEDEYDELVLSPQRIPVTLSVGELLDLSSELKEAGTEVDFGKISANAYTFEDGRLKFNKKGKYEICLSNETMLSEIYVWDESSGWYYDENEEGIVEVYYDITVKAEGGDDPDNPDDPTANEDEASSIVNVYVRNHTIYLSENLGEMRVFTVMGQCIHRGNGQSAEVPCAGLYIVQAGGRVWKVVVK